MKRLRQNESGSALVISLLALVFMSLLGMAALRILNIGLVHTSSAEARIQAEMLAQIGLDEVSAIVRHVVDEHNDPATGGSNTSYRGKIERAIDELKTALQAIADHTHSGDPFIVEFAGAAGKGEYVVKIESRLIRNPNDFALVTHIPDYPYVQQLIITSTGTTTKLRPRLSTTKRMELYVSTINPVFRYPVSASGGLILNGTPHIVGDVIVDDRDGAGNVTITNQAQFITDDESVTHKLQTGFPSMEGFIQSKGDYMVHNAVGVLEQRQFQRDFFQHKQPFLDEKLNWDETIHVQHIVSEVIDNASLIADLAASVRTRVDNTQTFGAKVIGEGRDIVGGEMYDGIWVETRGDLNVTGNLLVVDGTLFMDETTNARFSRDPDNEGSRSSLYVSFNDPNLVAAYLSGSLSIPDGEFVAIDGNVIFNNFTFEGTMLVKGNLKIIGDLNIKGSVYVDGEIEMKEMTSINQENSTDDQSVVLVSSGKIILSDNLSKPEQVSIIRAFLYAASGDMDLYGVVSHLEIVGGIHGKDVMLNAVRGQASKMLEPGLIPHSGSGYYFDADQESFAQLNPDGDTIIRSRLQLKHDLSLYTNPPIGIPVSDDIHMFIQEVRYVD